MKIKLALLEKDGVYLKRIVTAFSAKYADKFEIYSFTDESVALKTLESSKIDVLVASDVFNIDIKELPTKCALAYFVDSPGIETYNDQRAICKFIKADLIYKQILSVYAENAENVSGLSLGEDSCKTLAFNSACGGVGSSTMAAACAKYYALKGSKVLYLNFEKFGSSDIFFSGEGQFNMSDIIFALKSKKANISIKLESCVKQDKSGVYFYSAPTIALDILELSSDEIIRLVSEARLSGSYDYIILDLNFSMDKQALNILRQAHAIVWVSDGTMLANEKTIRAFDAFETIEKNEDSPLTSRLCLVYNKFSDKTGKIIDKDYIVSIGGAPRYAQATVSQMIDQIISLDIFGKIN